MLGRGRCAGSGLKGAFSAKRAFERTTTRAIRYRRFANRRRFAQPLAWIRVVALGIVLLNLAILMLLASYNRLPTQGFDPGIGALFGGALVGIIIVRIGSPKLYWDWILLATLIAISGSLVSARADSSSDITCAPVIATLAFGATTKIWIGRTHPPALMAPLLAGGITSLFCAVTLVIDYVFRVGIGPGRIVSIDLGITGLAIIYAGFASRNAWPAAKIRK